MTLNGSPVAVRALDPALVFLGADADGFAGLVSAPRHRLGVLIWITGVVARRRTCSAALLATLLGLWVHALLFRRPLLALFNQVFVDSRRLPASKVFRLRRDSVNELQAICWIAPLLTGDLRAGYVEALFAMDASLDGASEVKPMPQRNPILQLSSRAHSVNRKLLI